MPATLEPPAPKKRGRKPKPKEELKSYNPYRFERLLELVADGADGVVTFRTQSFTDNKNVWHPSIDTHSCRVECTCPHFLTRMIPAARRNGGLPTCYSPYLCKHLVQAVLILKQMGRLLEPEDVPELEPEEAVVVQTTPKPKTKGKKNESVKSGSEMLIEAVRASHASHLLNTEPDKSGVAPRSARRRPC